MQEPCRTNPASTRHRRSFHHALLFATVLATPAWALLPPMEVECCQRKDFTSDQCRRFALDEAKCAKANASWQETFRRFQQLQSPPPAKPADAAATAGLVPARIEARLYYSHSGTFSEAITDKMRFFNVIIGEGGAKEPSNTLRVDVVLKGAPGSFDPNAMVTLETINSETGKLLSKQTGWTGTLSARGEYRALFLLQKTGCIPLKLVASVTGSDARATVAIPFLCGE